MTRPGIVRADTLDLQDQEAPSAQDHSRQPSQSSLLSNGPTAPHQAAEIQHVYEEREAEHEHLVEAWTGRSSHEGREENDDHATLVNSVIGDDDSRFSGRTAHENGDDANEDGENNEGDMEQDEGLEDDMIDKVSSSPSIDDEDIDFQFVYALHTFVATVEGQANATKGDTMVLLDDSNSYWWLVKVVKDSSIGYLPAEHIETPTERLARLNKHRNLDLCQSMLSDNQEKKKNPLKIAMRRRGAPRVEFSMPTYHEPPDIDWSDEENGNGDSAETENGVRESTSTNQAQSEDSGETDDSEANSNASQGALIANARNASDLNNETPEQASRDASDEAGIDDEVVDNEELPPRRSKEGTLRNTDSFFKDDTAEPRKMTLTPNILRDDSSGRSSEASQKTADVFDRIDKQNSSTEKSKDEKKKKDKKPGMLSGLFKKKDKKVKVDEAAGGILSTSPLGSPTDSGRGSPSSRNSQSIVAPLQSPTTRQGKLVKSPPQLSKATAAVPAAPAPDMDLAPAASTQRESVTSKRDSLPVDPVNGLTREEAGDTLSEITNRPISQPTNDGPLTFAPDSQIESRDMAYNPSTQDSVTNTVPTDASQDTTQADTIPPQDLSVDSSAQDERAVSPMSETGNESPTAEAPTSDPKSSTDLSRSIPESGSTRSTASTSPATSPVATTPPPDAADPEWDDASLRSYLDTDSHADTKSLLLLVHDKTGVVPLSRDHPIMVSLGFQEHQKQINDMSNRLDGMLNGYLARKSSRSTSSSLK